MKLHALGEEANEDTTQPDFLEGFVESEQIINLNLRQDRDLMKNMNEVVKAYQILSCTSMREEYLKTIRLRSFAS